MQNKFTQHSTNPVTGWPFGLYKKKKNKININRSGGAELLHWSRGAWKASSPLHRKSLAIERKQVHLYQFKPDQWRCKTDSPSRSKQSRAGGEFLFLMPPSSRLAARSLRAQIKFKSKSQCEQTQRCQGMKASCQATKAKWVHQRRGRCLFANSK